MKKMMAALVALCMMMTAAGAMAAITACEGHTAVDTVAGLNNALSEGGSYCLAYISDSNASFTVAEDKDVVLCLHDGLSCATLTISQGATLTLMDNGQIVFSGHIINHGQLDIEFKDEDSRIQKNSSDSNHASSPVVHNKGTITMTGGNIYGNDEGTSNYGAVANDTKNSVFTMNGGQIWSKVINSEGKFYMRGGKIAGTGGISGKGYVESYNDATFEMTGGEIWYQPYGDYNSTLNISAGKIYSHDPGFEVYDYLRNKLNDIIVVDSGSSYTGYDQQGKNWIEVTEGTGGNGGNAGGGNGGGNAGGGVPGVAAPAGGAAVAADMPQTGDASMLGAWIALLGASGMSLKLRKKK